MLRFVHGGCDAVTIALRLFDALVFSSFWMSLVAAALVAASSRALGVPVDPRALGLALAGTFAVYNIDRLRDLERDRGTAPLRTAFVIRHRTTLLGCTVAALMLALLLFASTGMRAGALLLPALALGLAHRRLKRIPFLKPIYLVGAWLTVVVGLPWSLADGDSSVIQPEHVGWVTAILGLSIFPNAVASNIRDRDAGAARFGSARALAVARGLAAIGVGCGALAPAPVRVLVAVPVATLAALVGFRASERYGLGIVDGALLAGALVALARSVA